MKEKTLKGVFEKTVFAPSSKSEHEAIILKTDEGECYMVRLKGANPFDTSYLKPFLGKQAEVTGLDLGSRTVRVDNLSKIKPTP